MPRNLWLVGAGWSSVAAALLHIAFMIGGPDWYRFFGAGERVAHKAAMGSIIPPLMAVGIAAMLGVTAAFAFAGAGVISRLPLMRVALIAISTVLLARAAMAFVPAFWPPENRTLAFIATTSAICFIMGACFAIGTWRAWPRLSARETA